MKPLSHFNASLMSDSKWQKLFRIVATFEILTLTGWAAHESQQQPLRRGSAKTRLGDALAAIREKREE